MHLGLELLRGEVRVVESALPFTEGSYKVKLSPVRLHENALVCMGRAEGGISSLLPCRYWGADSDVNLSRKALHQLNPSLAPTCLYFKVFLFPYIYSFLSSGIPILILNVEIT